MKRILSRTRNHILNPLIQKLDANTREISALHTLVKEQQESLDRLKTTMDLVYERADMGFDVVKADRDKTAEHKVLLHEARNSQRYKKAYSKNPLITVRIATFNKAKELTEICIPSVLAQTYQNFEIIVIGDQCTDDTEQLIKRINDPRITFINLYNRSTYPDDKRKRWMVAGSPGMNLGATLAKGEWIAPLDDDDEFSSDHLEKLLKLAQHTKAELVYGALLQKHQNGDEFRIYSNPPILGGFSFQGAMYNSALNFFKYDEQSWVVGEPGDWNLCRRMLIAGIKHASTEDIVGIMHVADLNQKKHYKDEK